MKDGKLENPTSWERLMEWWWNKRGKIVKEDKCKNPKAYTMEKILQLFSTDQAKLTLPSLDFSIFRLFMVKV